MGPSSIAPSQKAFTNWLVGGQAKTGPGLTSAEKHGNLATPVLTIGNTRYNYAGDPIGTVSYQKGTGGRGGGKSTGPATNQTKNTGTTKTKNTGTTKTAYVDPYAKWGGQARFNTLKSGFDTQKSNIFNTANESADNAGIGLKSSILDLLNELRNGQQAIDNQGVNNELSFNQGRGDVLGMVGRGIRSGGVMLANNNASDSSAAQALAQAYGDIGQRELGKVSNQYQLEQRNIDQAQQKFYTDRDTGVRHIHESRDQTVNQIVLDGRNKLAQLDAAMVDADIPTRIALEQEKNNIRNSVVSRLSQFDSLLSNGVAGVQAMGADARRGEAAKLNAAGKGAVKDFNYQTALPAEFRDSGPFAAQLPVFIRRPGNDQGI